MDEEIFEFLKNKADLDKENRKTILHGNDVIHIDYISGVLQKDDLFEIKEVINSNNYRFSFYDKSNQITNNLDFDSSVVLLYLFNNVLLDLLKDKTLDFLKILILDLWKKVKGKKIKKLSGRNIEEKEASLGIKVEYGPNTKIEFKLENTDQMTCEKSIDKLFDFLKEEQKIKKSQLSKYNRELDCWEFYTIEDIIRKQREAQSKSP